MQLPSEGVREDASVPALVHAVARLSSAVLRLQDGPGDIISDYYTRREPYIQRDPRGANAIKQRCEDLHAKLSSNIEALRFTILGNALDHWRCDAAGNKRDNHAATRALAHMRNRPIAAGLNKWIEAAADWRREGTMMKAVIRMRHRDLKMVFDQWQSVAVGSEMLGREAFLRWRNRLMSPAFQTWRECVLDGVLQATAGNFLRRMLLRHASMAYQKWLGEASTQHAQNVKIRAALCKMLQQSMWMAWQTWQQESQEMSIRGVGMNGAIAHMSHLLHGKLGAVWSSWMGHAADGQRVKRMGLCALKYMANSKMAAARNKWRAVAAACPTPLQIKYSVALRMSAGTQPEHASFIQSFCERNQQAAKVRSLAL